MPRRNSTVKIENGKVVFLQEIIDYFESLRNEENSEWIDKYFNALRDENNLNAKKYNCHPIRPCFSFKDETHNTREETEPLANKIKENLIKLSIYNHIKAHYFLWKIYNNIDSKVAFQKMCGQHRYINNITEKELNEISILQENCAKENQTEEDVKLAIKEWSKTEKGKVSIKKSQEKYSNSEHGKRSIKESIKKYCESEHGKQKRKEYAQSENGKRSRKKAQNKYNKSEKGKKYHRNYNNRLCYDPKKENYCTYCALTSRKRKNKELYKDVILKNCIV